MAAGCGASLFGDVANRGSRRLLQGGASGCCTLTVLTKRLWGVENSAFAAAALATFCLRLLQEALGEGFRATRLGEKFPGALAMELRAPQHRVDPRVALFLVVREAPAALRTWHGGHDTSHEDLETKPTEDQASQR